MHGSRNIRDAENGAVVASRSVRHHLVDQTIKVEGADVEVDTGRLLEAGVEAVRQRQSARR
jgi:hypothetical protein